MNILHTALAAVLALGPLIVFHELGHYAVARLCGVKVLKFSIGFGKPLLRWRSARGDRTEWILAAIPLGGFVQMLDEREAAVAINETHRAFNRQSPWRRMAIVVAGPLANFVLAILVYAGIYMHGVTEPRAFVAEPVAHSVAAQSGLQAGDLIVEVNGEAVRGWNELRWLLVDLAIAGEQATLAVEEPGGAQVRRVIDFSSLDRTVAGGDPWSPIGLSLYSPPVAPVVGLIESGSAAELARLREGDRVLEIDGEPIGTWSDLVREVRRRPGRAAELLVQAPGGVQRTVQIVPSSATDRSGGIIGRIGVGPRVDPEALRAYYLTENFGPLEALERGLVKTADVSVFSLRMLGRMLTGAVSWRNLSGPVSIVEHAGQTASQGVLPFLLFVALMSISLGVLNLLPIPVLDGGHLLYCLCEVVRGRPLPDQFIEQAQRAGFAVLVALMFFAIFNDISRHFN